MPHHTSYDIKLRIPVLRDEHGYNIKEICGILGIKKSLVYKTLHLYDSLGVVTNPSARKSGRHRMLTFEDLNFIRVSIPTPPRTVRRLDFSCKQVSHHALECNAILHAMFMNCIADLAPDPEMLLFGDEAAKDRRTTGRKMGYSPKGNVKSGSSGTFRGTLD
ncbi:hypothetical protein BV22DRAFT_1108262 [Leucogyrophana mollusca]|uniref:Uncharacterized protein n=1 Tax=Leucogyrophana mollusca TaxID=85980 RepID=A0ACB8AZH0_9AGAM|nr:hypothetical protein BV22DRAFT_1108262 [Leucogyrophana mollusca]